jgi:hypothetical protein
VLGGFFAAQPPKNNPHFLLELRNFCYSVDQV